MSASEALDAAAPTRSAERREPARHASGKAPRRRAARLVVLGGLLVLVGWGAWLGYDAMTARRELVAAADLLAGLQDDVLAGDTDVSATLAEVQVHAAAALESTHGLHWSAAAVLPWVGGNVRAVQAVSEVVETLAADVLPDLAAVAAVVDPTALAPVDGRVDLAPLEAAAPTVVAAAEKVDEGQQRLDDIDADALWDVVASPLVDLRTKLDQLAMTTATASRAVQLLPPMMGADGPRTYLVLVQNPAEPRATGGVPALVTVYADAGVITVGEVVSATIGDPTPEAEPVVELTQEERSLFSNLVGGYMGDVTFTPDFPRSGELARAIWEDATGVPIDGVLSIEPGAIASILGVSGPVTLTDGVELTSENAAAWLMNTVYLDYTSSVEHDRLFAEAAGAAFRALTSGHWDASAMLSALARGAQEGRLMLWSARADEQAMLAGTVLSGELAGTRGQSPLIGVYINDGSQSKIGYYLGLSITGTSVQCRPDGSQDLTTRVEVTSNAPPDAAALPAYISGGRTVPPGNMRVNVLVYAPAGGLIEEVRIEGAEPGVHSQMHDGLAVVGKTVVLAPGQTAVMEYDLTTGPGQPGPAAVRATPLADITVEPMATSC